MVSSVATKACPNCHLINPDTAELCDCGYSFKSGALSSKPEWAPRPKGCEHKTGTLVVLWSIGFLSPSATVLIDALGCRLPGSSVHWAMVAAFLWCAGVILTSRMALLTGFLLVVATVGLLAVQEILVGLILFSISGFEGIQ